MITSNNNAKVKQVVQWQTKAKERRKDHVFLAEGIRMCEEAPVKNVREVYLTEELEQKIRQNAQNGDTAFWDKLQQTGYETVSTEVFAKMADTQTPQGILTVLEQPVYDLTQLLEQPDPLFLMLENLQDPGNLGTMIRTGEGAGITGVIMNNQTVDIFNPKTIRATMGSIFRVPFVYVPDLAPVLEQMHAKGIYTYAAHLKGQEYYDSFPGAYGVPHRQRRKRLIQGNLRPCGTVSQDPHGGQGGIPECLHCSGPSDVRGPQTAKRRTVTIPDPFAL